MQTLERADFSNSLRYTVGNICDMHYSFVQFPSRGVNSGLHARLTFEDKSIFNKTHYAIMNYNFLAVLNAKPANSNIGNIVD